MIITIGGVPAAGKTFTSKLLAEKLNCIAIEAEALRWDFFNENIDNNVFYYTKFEPFKNNESMRDYYLRNTLYDNKMPLEVMIQWHKDTMKYINVKLYKVLNDYNAVKTLNDYDNFCKKYIHLINFCPKYESLNKDFIIFSHAFINITQFSKLACWCFNLDSSENTLLDRFVKRENLIVANAINLTNYFKSYRVIVEESSGCKLDSACNDIVNKITNILNIKNEIVEE